MRSLLLALGALLLCATASTAGEIKIAWYGQSFFQVVTPKGTKVALDPHAIEEYRIEPIKVDLVLMSHLHNDHTTLEGSIEKPGGKDAKDHTGLKMFNALEKTGESELGAKWNEVKGKVGDVTFFSLGTFHDDQKGMKRGKNGCWVLDIDGVRIVHLGDLGHELDEKQLKKLGKVDVLMIPVGGVYTLNGLQAFRVFRQVNPSRCIIPMHYGTSVYDHLLSIDTFAKECKLRKIPMDKLPQKQWLTIDTSKKPPKEARMVEMHHTGAGMHDVKAVAKDKRKDKTEK